MTCLRTGAYSVAVRSIRRLLCLLLAVAVLALIGVITVGQPDRAWTPSYFDDQDEDLALWIWSDGNQVMLPAAGALLMLLAALVGPVLLRCSALSLLAVASPRLRAPPLA